MADEVVYKELSLLDLISDLEYAIKKYFDFFSVSIQIGTNDPELIINPRSNFSDKLEYYKNRYNNDLTMKTTPFIKIVHWDFGNEFDELSDGIYL